MAVGRAERRRERRVGVAAHFDGDDVERVLDLLELVELAWHDCYGEVSPPEAVVEDILLAAESDWRRLISAARLAVIDRRDLHLQVEARRTDDSS